MVSQWNRCQLGHALIIHTQEGGQHQHRDSPDAVTEKWSFEAALEACQDGMEKHSQIDNEGHQAQIEDCERDD